MMRCQDKLGGRSAVRVEREYQVGELFVAFWCFTNKRVLPAE